jgi:hypothetical protein
MEEDHTAMSYAEWNAAGYHIIKGSKSQMRDALGVPQFTKCQVEKNRPRISMGEARTNSRTLMERSSARAHAKGTPGGVIEDFDSFVREAGMLPTMRRRVFAISSPLEMHFMNVADKHGILDGILDGDEDDYH